MDAFVARFRTLDADDYFAPIDDDGLDYLTTYLADVTAFHQRAARAGWATVFTADQ